MRYKDRKRWLAYAAKLESNGDKEQAQQIRDMVAHESKNSNSREVKALQRDWHGRQQQIQHSQHAVMNKAEREKTLSVESASATVLSSSSDTVSSSVAEVVINPPAENAVATSPTIQQEKGSQKSNVANVNPQVAATVTTEEQHGIQNNATLSPGMITLLGEEVIFMYLAIRDPDFSRYTDLGSLFLQRFEKGDFETNGKMEFKFDGFMLPELGKLFFKYRKKLNEKMQGILGITALIQSSQQVYELESKDYIGIGINFINCFASENNEVLYVISSIIMARALKRLMNSVNNAQPNKPIMNMNKGETPDSMMIRALLQDGIFGMKVESFNITSGPALNESELNEFRNFYRGIAIPENLPEKIKQLLSKQEFENASHAMREFKINEVKPVCDYLLCLVRRFDELSIRYEKTNTPHEAPVASSVSATC